MATLLRTATLRNKAQQQQNAYLSLSKTYQSIIPSCLIPNQNNTTTSTSPASSSFTVRWMHQSAPRYQSSQNKSSSSSSLIRDTRLAGRRRFYKRVDICPALPPWETSDREEDEEASDSLRRFMLTPRQPGFTDQTTNSTNSTSTPEEWYGITLDDHPIRTPNGTPLVLPNATLALGVATEWDNQQSYLMPAQMPLTTLACTALDQASINATAYQKECLQYFHTDTLCFGADAANTMDDRGLFKRQERAWKDIRLWIMREDVLGPDGPAMASAWDDGLMMLMLKSRRNRSKAKNNNDNDTDDDNTDDTTTAGPGLPHPPLVLARTKQWIESLDAWHLTAMRSASAEAKSFLVGMALICSAWSSPTTTNTQSSSSLPPPPPPFVNDTIKAITASRVEEEFQIEHWGLVEGGHDYDRLNCSIAMHSSCFLVTSMASVPLLSLKEP